MKKILKTLSYENSNSNQFKKSFAKRMLFCISMIGLIAISFIAVPAITNGFDFADAGMCLASVLPLAMTTETKSMHEKRAKLVLQMKEIAEKAKAEGRDMNKEENITFDKLDDEAEGIMENMKRISRISELTESENERLLKLAKENKGDNSSELAAEESKKRDSVFSRWMVKGMNALTAEEKTILRAQSTTTTEGGYTIPQGFMAKVAEAMLAFGGMRQIATILPTVSGNTIPWPNNNDTSNKGELLAENTAVNEQDLVFGSTSLLAYKYSSKMVRVSNELLNDSAIGLESYLSKALGTRIARITNEHFTTGTGSGQPSGIITGAALGKTTASETAVTYEEIIDLIHSVDPEYRKNGVFCFHDSTLKALKKLSVGSSDARTLWDPGIFRNGVPPTIDGYKYIINQDMAQIGTASNKFMLFGDCSYYIIRDIGSMVLRRLDERYADYDQVAFLAFSRHDGRKIASDNPFKYMQAANT